MLFDIVLFIVDQLLRGMSNILQGEKMKTPQYFDEGELEHVTIPRVCYKISMEIRNKAAQATIAEFTKPTPTLVSKNSPVYSDSDSSTSGGPDASNSKSPSPASLRVFINALPNLEPLHFGSYLSKDDKR